MPEVWEQNPSLNRPDKFTKLDERYGDRIIYIPGYACPLKACPEHEVGRASCQACGLTSNSFKMVYDDPLEVSVVHPLVRLPPQSELTERIPHRWLTLAPVLTDVNGITYEFGADWGLIQRQVVWIGKSPAPSTPYTVAYNAYAEDSVYTPHAMLAEKASIQSWAFVPQGQVGVSIPADQRSYFAKPGDLFVMADWAVTGNQVLALESPWRRSTNRWVIDVVRAFGLHRTSAYNPNAETSLASYERVDVTDGVTFDYPNKNWVLDPAAIAGLERVSITYRHAPIYVMNMDMGEVRNPHFGALPKRGVLAKSETVL